METSRFAIISGNSTPTAIVAGNDDLLTEILKHLPVISLLRFKSVSKHWLSLIIDPQFSRLLNPNRSLPSGFFLPIYDNDLEFDFVPFDGENSIKSPFTRLNFAPDLSGLTILSSCNGLLCCGNISSGNGRILSDFHVYNPSNQKFVMVPRPDIGARNRIFGVNLAFDPSKSPLFKVICLVIISRPPEPIRIRIHIYSWETGDWKRSVEFNYCRTRFNGEVYFNGAIHWVSWSLSTCYFNVDQEQIHVMPMPPVSPESEPSRRSCCYFGESSGHLLLIETFGPIKIQFNVFEMERDCSGWSLRYRVDLNAMGNTYPEMILGQGDPMNCLCYRFYLLYVFEGAESCEDSYMVVYIPGKIVRYNLVDKTFKLLFDYDPISTVDCFSSYNSWKGVFPFIASLALC